MFGTKSVHSGDSVQRSALIRRSAEAAVLWTVFFFSMFMASTAVAQEPAPPAETNQPVTGIDSGPGSAAEAPAAPATTAQASREINFFDLLVSGGWFMVPLLIFSLIAVTFTIE